MIYIYKDLNSLGKNLGSTKLDKIRRQRNNQIQPEIGYKKNDKETTKFNPS
jgi:hypothetical protein